MRYFIKDCAFNRENYPDIIETIHDNPPGYALVRPVITCCGNDVVCENFTNTCPDCGADYNSSGQLLAPRAQWGEETGEHWSDCY